MAAPTIQHRGSGYLSLRCNPAVIAAYHISSMPFLAPIPGFAIGALLVGPCVGTEFTTMSRDSVHAAWPKGLPPEWIQLDAHERALHREPWRSDAVVYRLIWLRAFHDPVVVRLTIGPRAAVVTWKTGKVIIPANPPLPYRFPMPPNVRWTCGRAQVAVGVAAAVRADFARSGFWAMEDTTPRPTPGELILDGSHWVLEARDSLRIHGVVSRPVASIVERLGLRLVGLTALRIPKDAIY